MAVAVTVNGQATAPGLDPATSERTVLRAVQAVLADREVRDGTVSVTLLDDAAMKALNRQWKGRDEPTDVLAFALHAGHEPPLGDVYLGIERARAQAAALGEPPARELARLVIHGTLHVLGFDHPEEDREDSELWRHQERILSGVELE